jgi:hypothetical protein
MSAVVEDPTPAARRRLPRGRVGAVAGLLLLAGAAYGLSANHVGGIGANPGSKGASAQVQDNASRGSSGGNGAANGSSSGNNAQGGNHGNAAPGGGAGNHAATTSTPQPTLAPIPDSGIAGRADWQQSDCAGTFEPGDNCSVPYTGEYFLKGTTTETVLIKATTKDGRVLAQQSYPAPAGGHRYGAVLNFTVPKDVTVIYTSAVLQDAQGKVIASTVIQENYAA